MAHYQLHRWKMQKRTQVGPRARSRSGAPGYVEEVYGRIADDGPVVAGDLSRAGRQEGAWWDWDDAKVALEHLFWKGRVSARRRRDDFARVYDLTERVIPAEVLARPDVPEREARKQLLELAARHHGIATFADLTDYHRQANQPCKPLVAELVEEGRCAPVEVEGWKKPAYMHHRRARAAADQRACAAEPVRPDRVEPRSGDAIVRLPLPHRDLHAAAEADLWLLRAADPVGRRASSDDST